MMNPNLAHDEGILLESDENAVLWITGSDTQLQKMTLTNKNIYLAYRKKISMFKSTDDLITRPLTDIKIINGKPMVEQVKNDIRGICLQIQFTQGRELFYFFNADRKESAKWVNALYRALIGTDAPPEALYQKSGILDGLGLGNLNLGGLSNLGGLAASLKTAASSALQNAMGQTQQNTQEYVQPQIPAQQCVEPAQPAPVAPRPTGGFCSNCGGRLDAGARFCPGCGAPVTGTAQAVQTPPPVPVASPAPVAPPVPVAPVNPSTRQQEYAGIILKCPNCGESISNTDVVCPSCGHQITGRAASNTVQRLQAELMAIENSRQAGNKKGFGILRSMIESETEEEVINQKKVTLIGSFPIPNTIEEIVEFVILAAGNINVNVSKLNMFGRQKMEGTPAERKISDAWIGKLQQAYQKAELMFSDKPSFEKIRDIYQRKMKELNMLKNK